MPPRKRQQSNAMLYTLIAFVGLFIIATTFAIVYYVKAEDLRTSEEEAQRNLSKYVSSTEEAKIGSLVEAPKSQQTYIGTLINHLNRVVSLATGTVPNDTTAENKVAQVFDELKNAISLTAQYTNFASQDPNSVGLVRIIKELKTNLDNSKNTEIALNEQIKQLQQKFDDALAATIEKEKTLLAEKDRLEQQVGQITKDYNDLEVLLNQTASQREQNLMSQLNQQKDIAKQLNLDLLKTNAQLDMTQKLLDKAEKDIAVVKGPPDVNVPAYRPDGRIILLDEANKVVHVSIGSDDRVYRGLTFSVYDKGQGIPKDGKAKAEIEIFDVAKSFAAARIVQSDLKRPILMGDIIANVIWDGSRSNVFVIAGEFDINEDGNPDRDAVDKLTSIIEKWGGQVTNDITVDTDYLVLGNKPTVLAEPTAQELEIDPQATRKYENSKQMLERYNNLMANAEALWIPILKYDRFLYFIGYKGQIGFASEN